MEVVGDEGWGQRRTYVTDRPTRLGRWSRSVGPGSVLGRKYGTFRHFFRESGSDRGAPSLARLRPDDEGMNGDR
jgi:hypothetical protein